MQIFLDTKVFTELKGKKLWLRDRCECVEVLEKRQKCANVICHFIYNNISGTTPEEDESSTVEKNNVKSDTVKAKLLQ